MDPFFSFKDGYMHIEDVSVAKFKSPENETEPVYIYSKNRLILNIQQYKQELDGQVFSSTLNYSMKANANPAILSIIKDLNCSATVVSGMELKLALDVGFPPSEIVFNGNGKETWEIELAITNGVLLNIDSVFNLMKTIKVAQRLKKPARSLLRINPNIEVQVHEYVSTGKSCSKFGLDDIELKEVVSILKNEVSVQLIGLHCHLGSTIDNVTAIEESTKRLVTIFKQLQEEGFVKLKYINIGGGLGIPYNKCRLHTQAWKSLKSDTKNYLENIFNEFTEDVELQKVADLFKGNKISTQHFLDTVKTQLACRNSELAKKLEMNLQANDEMPTPADLMRKIKDHIHKDMHLMLEPGRSLIGNTAILLCSVLGCKQSGDKNFIVVNGAMTEVLRPSLYGAYHHIVLTEPTESKEKQIYDIVGPVCESADFFGKDRLLENPKENSLLAVLDVGAYCSTMAMTYNMRRRCAEILVDGDKTQVIRRADTYEDLLAQYRL